MNTTEKNAEQAAEAWTGKLGAYSRSTRTIALALAAHYDKSELAATLAHEGIGHSGINTFSCAEKRGLIDAIIESRKHPGALRDSYWKAVEDAYPNLRKSEQAEEIFSLMAETVQRVGRDSCKKPQKCTYPLDSIEIIVASKFIGPILRRKSSV